jgi:phosphoribosyl-AMP cyclohydrolase
VTGSRATGSATARSALALRLLTWEPPEGHVTWFAETAAGTLHVSLETAPVDRWVERGGQVVPWALGFPARCAARFAWATDEARARLGDDPSHLAHPAAPPALERCVDGLRATLAHAAAKDWLGTRCHAQEAAERMPGLLRGINPYRSVSDRRDALEAALELPVAPASWGYDLPVMLGLEEASGPEVADAASRLGLELLELLRSHVPGVDRQPGLAEALADGTLERLLSGPQARAPR